MNSESVSPQRMSGFSNVDHAAGGYSWYVEYLKRVNEVIGVKRYKQKVLEFIDPKPEEHILDIGCGIGVGLQAVYNHTPTVKSLVGIDNAQAMIDQANALTPQELLTSGIFTYQQGDAHKLPFEDKKFDACYSDRTFQHLANPDLAFREMIRVTKVDGRVVIADTDWQTLQIKGVSSETDERIRRTYLNIIANPRMGGTLQELFTEHGLADVEVVKNPIELLDPQTIKDVLGLESSLERARINGALSKEDVDKSIKEIREIQQAQDVVQASFCIFIAKGIKSS